MRVFRELWSALRCLLFLLRALWILPAFGPKRTRKILSDDLKVEYMRVMQMRLPQCPPKRS